MKTSKTIITTLLIFVSLLTLGSCKKSLRNMLNGPMDLTELESSFSDEFGKDIYVYSIMYHFSSGNGWVESITFTKDPNSNTLEEWTSYKGSWKQIANVTLELESGKPSDFLYSFDEINFKLINQLVQESIQKTKTEHNIEKLVVTSLSLSPSDEGGKSEGKYFIDLMPENGGTKFGYMYNIQGKLLNESMN